MFVQLVTPLRVTHLQRYDVMLRGNVTSIDQGYKCVGTLSSYPIGREQCITYSVRFSLANMFAALMQSFSKLRILDNPCCTQNHIANLCYHGLRHTPLPAEPEAAKFPCNILRHVPACGLIFAVHGSLNT